MKVLFARLLAWLFPLAILCGPAQADRAALMPAVSASIARSAEEAEELASCLMRLQEGSDSALALLAEEWKRRSGLWIATLWATGFSETEIRALTVRLDAATLPPNDPRQTKCVDPIARLGAYLNQHPPIDASAIAARGISWGEVIVDTPDSADRIEAAVTPRLRRWAELLACAQLPAAETPTWFGFLRISEGNFALEAHRLRIFLQQKGLPRPKVNRVLARIILQVRWNRPQATVKACNALHYRDTHRWGGPTANSELAATAAAELGLRPPD
jgi:hypothetical protein